MASEEAKFEKLAEEQKPEQEEGFKKEGDLWVPKEERGHIRSAQEVEYAREEIPEEKKVESAEERDERKEREWKYGTRTLERIRDAEREWAEEKKAMESAKIPEKGMETENILKEAGIQKPAESFEEVQKRLEEKLEKARVGGGEKLSLAEKNETTRDFYLGELGYSVEYKGLLHGKAELLDESGKVITDEKGDPMEFKTFFKMGREETPMIDFLKERLKEKQKGKPVKEMSEEERLEAGFQKATKTVEQRQGRRKEKISSLQDVKKVGKERLNKLVEGLSYVAALDKLSILGLKEGRKLAIEGGKDLAAIGLTPAAAVEEAGRYVAGRIQIGEALRKSIIMREKAKLLEKVPIEKRPAYFDDLFEAVMKAGTEKASEELMRGYDKIYKKGRILRLIEALGGRTSKPIGRTFGPPSKQEKI
jgi:hypothetical protein